MCSQDLERKLIQSVSQIPLELIGYVHFLADEEHFLFKIFQCIFYSQFNFLQFNLAIQDVPEVLAEAKRALTTELISSSIPLCIEISLRTVEGDTMVLETWSLGVLSEQTDPSVRVTYTVYNIMGILLKSLLSISRITPAYKLSRRQGPDSYVICYRIYLGEPQLHNLGKKVYSILIILKYHSISFSVKKFFFCLYSLSES